MKKSAPNREKIGTKNPPFFQPLVFHRLRLLDVGVHPIYKRGGGNCFPKRPSLRQPWPSLNLEKVLRDMGGHLALHSSQKILRQNVLREISPRVSTRWQISLLTANFTVKNVVKTWWQILRLFFLGKFVRKRFPPKNPPHVSPSKALNSSPKTSGTALAQKFLPTD